MGAHVEHRFEGRFLLDEERIRKLKDIVDVRTDTLVGDNKLGFKVYRADSFYYETNLIEDVISETNEDWRKIERIVLFLKVDPVIDFKIDISSGGVTLHIVGEDRDAIFLLFSEVKNYMVNEVVVKRIYSGWIPASLVFMTFIFVVAFNKLRSISRDEMSQAALNKALNSDGVVEKLNYLILRQSEGGADHVSNYVIIGGFAFVFYIVFLNGKVMNFFRPANVFIFGRGKEKFERQQELAEKVIWVVGVGFAVSIIASAVVWALTG